jgi:hypothetical protein
MEIKGDRLVPVSRSEVHSSHFANYFENIISLAFLTWKTTGGWGGGNNIN